MNYIDLIMEALKEGFGNTGINTSRILVALGLAFVIGLYIYYVYRGVSKDGFYSRSFSIALGILAPIMAGMVLTMQSSLIISLSSIGALSIIRFRTPIKDPMDLLFLFWSIGSGIMCGAGTYEIAVITTLMVTIGVLILSVLPVKKSPCLLVLNGDDYSQEEAVMTAIKDHAKYCKVKSKNITAIGFDMVVEIKTAEESELISALREVKGVQSISVLEHDGELRE
ncbi:MAG: DUF4956 domain-containing protein [Lachnospiraceae bacterium]|nr:DUF4956 domain-containing protein [Lachnospiraceae bacterium]